MGIRGKGTVGVECFLTADTWWFGGSCQAMNTEALTNFSPLGHYWSLGTIMVDHMPSPCVYHMGQYDLELTWVCEGIVSVLLCTQCDSMPMHVYV